MDKIELLKSRRSKLFESSSAVRADVEAIVDKDSLVELASYSYSESEFYDGTAEGEGVVCGFATVDDCPYYVIAQNAAVLSGGVSKANCKKIADCLFLAAKSGTPVIYLLSSAGVRIGEGVNVLEGIADLVAKASRLKDVVSQYLIVNGEVYGQISLLAGICDFNFFVNKKSVLALNSPLVISAAAGLNLDKEKIGGGDALNKSGLVSFCVKDLSEARSDIIRLNELLNVSVVDCDIERINKPISALNRKCDVKGITEIFDKNSAIELYANVAPDIRCYLARIGGYSVAALVFDGGADGVKLCPCRIRKINNFAALACEHNLPFITFVNTKGVTEKFEAVNSSIVKDLCEYVRILDGMSTAKISVVYGKAIGLGYTLFAAKSLGYDYSFAFANSKIALFDDVQGAEIEFSVSSSDKKNELIDKYADENSDPVNAAKGGYVDNIIEPAMVRNYLFACLQMLVK